MANERTDELIQMDVDGALSPGQKAALDAALAADDEARASLASYRLLARELESLPVVDPPPLLASSVARAVRARHLNRPATHAAPSPASRRRHVLYLGYAAAAGLLLGLLTAPFLMRTDSFHGPVEAGNAAASIGAAELSSWEIVDRRTASTAGGSVRLLVRRNGTSLGVEAAFTDAGSEAVISWNPARASLLAFVRDRSSGTPVLERGRIRAPIRGGGTLTLVLETPQASGPIHVDVDGTRILSSDPPLESSGE
ncbi:MAG TPA: hypothetical protein VFV54_03885 [Thermoanaerobaculia bacterium]|nr:hypothetical protein [Thermoanaerobaculia bacterium]